MTDLVPWECPRCHKTYQVPKGRKIQQVCKSCFIALAAEEEQRKARLAAVPVVERAPAAPAVTTPPVIKPVARKMPQFQWWWLAAIIPVVVVIFLAYCVSLARDAAKRIEAERVTQEANAVAIRNNDPPVEGEKNFEEMLQAEARLTIKQYLLSPRSAEFEMDAFNKDEKGIYYISGRVDSQNAQGVFIRYDWKVGIKSSERYESPERIVEVHLGGKVVHMSPSVTKGVMDFMRVWGNAEDQPREIQREMERVEQAVNSGIEQLVGAGFESKWKGKAKAGFHMHWVGGTWIAEGEIRPSNSSRYQPMVAYVDGDTFHLRSLTVGTKEWAAE